MEVVFRLIKGRDLLTVERPRGCICFATAWQRARVPISSATLSALVHCRPGYAPASSYSRVRQLAPQTRNLRFALCLSFFLSLAPRSERPVPFFVRTPPRSSYRAARILGKSCAGSCELSLSFIFSLSLARSACLSPCRPLSYSLVSRICINTISCSH